MKKLKEIIEDVNSILSDRFIAKEAVSMSNVESLLESKMREEHKYHHFFVTWESNSIKFKDAGIEFKVKKRKRTGFIRYHEPKMTCVKLELVYDTNNRMDSTIKEIDDKVEQRKIFLKDVSKQKEQDNIAKFNFMLEKHKMTHDEFREMQRLYKSLPHSEQYKK